MRSLWLFGLVIAHMSASAVTLNIDAESLKTASGTPMNSGVIVLVADVKDSPGPAGTQVRNGFSGPTASSFSGGDFQVFRWNFSPASPEYFGPGAFQAALNLRLEGAWQAGDPLRLYWFPENGPSDTVPGAGKPFGAYRSDAPDPGSPGSFGWFTPSESALLSLNGETATVPKESTVSLAFLTTDADTLVPLGLGTVPATAASTDPAIVVGRYIFYNNSTWDGNSAAANPSDDGAIAPDKFPLFAGSTASFANHTSFSRGINGIMVDIFQANNAGAVSASDFTFRVGNDNNPADWAIAPAPISITRRALLNGNDRFTILWADNAIQNQWLQISVLPTANTGLGAPEIFYFGNAIGDVGNSLNDSQVNAIDRSGVQNNPHNVSNPALITNPYDFNRDARVNAIDRSIVRNSSTTVATALKRIVLP